MTDSGHPHLSPVIKPLTGEAGKRGVTYCDCYRNGEHIDPPSDLAAISDYLAVPGTLVWLDLADPYPHDLALLQEEFALHPLAIEDAEHAHQRPKIEAYDGRYWFVVIFGVSGTPGNVTAHELAIFVGERFLVTVRDAPPFPLQEVQRRWAMQPTALRRDPGFLLYTLMDTIVDGYRPLSDTYEEQVAQIEQELLAERPDLDAILRELFTIRNEVLELRRIVLPVRDILTPIIRGDLQLFADDERSYYRDVYDHVLHVIEELETARDDIANAMQIHLSVTSKRLAEAGHHQGEVNKQLTLIATIFLPLTFITGFFGQNFAYLVNHLLGSEAAFWWLGVGLEVIAVVALLAFIRVRGWF